MSLALYRKYRPSVFADVIGQEHVTVPLSNALESGRTHHAYLFSGPRGCGKTSSARIMDVLGTPIDERGPVSQELTASIHRKAPAYDELSPSQESQGVYLLKG